MSDIYKESVRYKQHSVHDNFIILYDKLDLTFAIHSKDPCNDTGIIANFKFASQAIDFAEKRVVAIDRDSRL